MIALNGFENLIVKINNEMNRFPQVKIYAETSFKLSYANEELSKK